MDNFIVSARKYRPTTFDSVVGQQHITSTLKNAIRNNQLAQAFLFCGPRGVGKTTCARILAKTINCENINANTEACDTCPSCRSFAQGASFSIHELDAASNNSVDDIRTLIEQVRIPPQSSKYKIYIIDEVHMLSQSAFNAFLKTLEEPPSYAIFILATTEKHKILPTILSRCQIFDFNRIKVEDMTGHLATIAEKEGVRYETDGLHIIAQKADGGLRDALSMFDQIASFSEKSISYKAVVENLSILDYDYYFKIAQALYGQQTADALLVLHEIMAKGFESGQFIAGLNTHFRNLLMAKEPSTVILLELSEGVQKRYLEQAGNFPAGWLLSVLNIGNQVELQYKASKNPRLQVELALLKMGHVRAALQLKPGAIEDSRPVAEKKKPLRQIDPEPEPKRKAEAVPEQQIETTPLQQTETIPVKAAARSWSDARLGGDLPGLQGPESPPENDLPTLISGDTSRKFSESEMMSVWHTIATEYKELNKQSVFTLLTANPPKLLDDAKIEVLVENPIQLDLLQNEKYDIINALRRALKNYEIDLVPRMAEQDIVRKPYTSMEKFQALLSKNPLLERLQQDFNLGLD